MDYVPEQVRAQPGAHQRAHADRDAARDALQVVRVRAERSGVEHRRRRLERRAGDEVAIIAAAEQAVARGRADAARRGHPVSDEAQVSPADRAPGVHLVQLVSEHRAGGLDAEHRRDGRRVRRDNDPRPVAGQLGEHADEGGCRAIRRHRERAQRGRLDVERGLVSAGAFDGDDARLRSERHRRDAGDAEDAHAAEVLPRDRL